MFSTSDEYETALITERRAQGRYAPPRSRWPLLVFAGCALIVAGAVAAPELNCHGAGDAGRREHLFLGDCLG